MRINKLKEKLKQEIKEKLFKKENKNKSEKVKEPIIIGITGSRGNPFYIQASK